MPYLSSGAAAGLTPARYLCAYRGTHSSSVAEKPLWGQGMLLVQFPKTGPGLVLLKGQEL